MTAASHSAVDEFIDSADWQRRVSKNAWILSQVSPSTLIVQLNARPLPEVNGQFTLRIECEPYPALPPDIRFVNPETLLYDPATDQRHVARLTATDCYTHLEYPYPVASPYGPQLVCTSMGYGYYVSQHVPTPEQRWDPQKHSIGTTVQVIHRTLQSPSYTGRF